MVQLSPAQAKELRDHGTPPRVVAEGTEYVLIRADIYERIKEVIEQEPEEIDPSLYEFDEVEHP